MHDVIVLTDQRCDSPAFLSLLAQVLTVSRTTVDKANPETVASARVVVLHTALRKRDDVARLSKLLGDDRRRTETIYAAVGSDRAAVVQAEALGIGCIVPDFRPPEDVVSEVQAVLSRKMGKRLANCSKTVARAVESGDALFRQLGVAMRANKPLRLDAVGLVAKAIGEATLQEGLSGWLEAVQLHHSGTCRHILTVAGHACAFGRFLDMHESDVAMLAQASLLHDVGKLFIPISVLEKSGPLTDTERAAINTHCERGAAALVSGGVTDQHIIAAVRDHHEYLDGSGYPRGIKQARIGPLTRMVTIADIYSALTEERAYKAAMTPRQAIGVMLDLKGKIDERLFAEFRSMVLLPVFEAKRRPAGHAGGKRKPCLRDGCHPLDAIRDSAA